MSTFAAPASATSGLQGYELEGSKGPGKSGRNTSLYIKRRVRNADEIISWAKAQGFPTTLAADDMHVTIAYSKADVAWDDVEWSSQIIMRVVGGDRALKRLGKDGEAVVLRISSDDLDKRHREIRAAGASWDHPSYQPHITISYNGSDVDLDKIAAFAGTIELGPEEWEPIKENWMASVVEKDAPLMATGIALVTNEGTALFLRRSAAGDHAGEWCLPGGQIETGETPQVAAVRETREETGFSVPENGEQMTFVSTIANDKVNFTTFFQRLEGEFEPKLNNEHDAHRWAFLEKPPQPLHPGLRAALPLIISQATEVTMKAAHSGDVNMNDLSLFVQLRKVDAKERIVYGTAVVEQPDLAKEIFDYASSKPEFEKWTADVQKASDGKSYGNVRSMHNNIAAGKLVNAPVFDDERKAIDIAAKVVDDNEWAKVEQGVYTGFSIGGKYIKRWKDGDYTRYTAAPAEVSLVDRPCVPDATFSMIKADGSEELRKFVTPEKTDKTETPKEITNDMVVARAGDIAKAKGGDWVDHVVDARKELTSEMEKAAMPKTDKVEEKTVEKTAEKTADVIVTLKVDATEAAAEIAKAAEAAAALEAAAKTPLDVEQVWISKRLPGVTFPKKVDLAKALVELDAQEAAAKAAGPVLDALKLEKMDGETDEAFEKRKFTASQRKKDAKSGAAEGDGSYPIQDASDLENAIKAYGRSKNKAKTKRHIISRARALGLTDKLPEGWVKKIDAPVEGEDVQKAADLYFVADLLYMLSCVEGLEEQAEFTSLFGGIAVPKDLTDRFGSALVALGDVTADMLDLVLGEMRAEEAAEATKSVELVELIKRGARNSKRDKGLVKQAHDAMVSLDKDSCPGSMDKAAPAEDLAKATAEIETLTTENVSLKAEKAANGDLLQDIKAGIEAMKGENASLREHVVKLQKDADVIGMIQKDVLALRNMPASSPPGSFRVVEKVAAPSHTEISSEELNRRANLASFASRDALR